MRPRSREVAAVSAAFLAQGSFFFDRFAPIFVVTLIARDLGADPSAIGMLALAIGFGWAAATGIVRWTSVRWGNRRRILIAALVSVALGVASAGATGWAMFVLLRGLAGVAAGSGSPAVTALVFSAAAPKRRGTDMGIVLSSTRILGNLLSPAMTTAIAVTAGWRPALIASSAVVLLAAAATLWLVEPDGPDAAATRRTGRYELHPGGRRRVVVSGIACTGLLAWLFVFSQSAVPMLSGWLGVTDDVAGRLAGWLGIGGAITALLIPMASDRIGRAAALALGTVIGGGCGLTVAGAAAAGVGLPRPAIALLLLGAGTSLGALPLVISIIPAEAVASGDVARALILPVAGSEVVGAALVPGLAGAGASVLGHAEVVAIAAGLVLLTTAAAPALRPRPRSLAAP